jgi:hypothetical protein
VHKGLSTCTLKEGSTFIEAEGEYQHITTAIGYCVDYEWPTKGNRIVRIDDPQPITHFWS